MSLQILPIHISHDIEEGESLDGLICKSKNNIEDGDIIVISQKVVSKQEGRIIKLDSIFPSLLSTGIASEYGKDPKLVEAILSESKRIVRMENGIIIVETNGGFVCANAGIDESNVNKGYVTLLPLDPDKSATSLKDAIHKRTKKDVAVIISDTFGRPFRMGQTDCAIGVSGIDSILDYAGTKDTFGKELRVTAIAIADELCSAAELVCGKTAKTPVAIVRGYTFESTFGTTSDLLRPKDQDLFR